MSAVAAATSAVAWAAEWAAVRTSVAAAWAVVRRSLALAVAVAARPLPHAVRQLAAGLSRRAVRQLAAEQALRPPVAAWRLARGWPQRQVPVPSPEALAAGMAADGPSPPR